ncbi:MAG: 30S ribosomal protein S27e [archaeon]|nr:30S ribosomal protein S27e [archaeon]
MKKERILIPKSRSAFLLVRCSNCGNEQVVFSSPTVDIKCKVCDSLIAQRTGGKAKMLGTVSRRLD